MQKEVVAKIHFLKPCLFNIVVCIPAFYFFFLPVLFATRTLFITISSWADEVTSGVILNQQRGGAASLDAIFVVWESRSAGVWIPRENSVGELVPARWKSLGCGCSTYWS